MLDKLVAQLATLRVANIPVGETLLLAAGNCLADIFLKTSYGLGNTVKVPKWLSGGIASWGIPSLLKATTIAGPNTQERLTTIMFSRLIDDTVKLEENVTNRIQATLQAILGGRPITIGAADEDEGKGEGEEEVIYLTPEEEEQTKEIGYASENEEEIGYADENEEIGYADEGRKKTEDISNRLLKVMASIEN